MQPGLAPELVEHIVQHCVAVQRLEGCVLGEEEIHRLRLLAEKKLNYGTFIAPFLKKYRTPQTTEYRRPLFSRRNPYELPGKMVLRNNFRLADNKALSAMEAISSSARMVEVYSRYLQGRLPVDSIEPLQLHQYLFSDVYSWAGTVRSVGISKNDSSFATPHKIPVYLRQVAVLSDSLQFARKTYSTDQLALVLAEIYTVYNKAHPFREGNGRTGMLYLQLLAHQGRHTIDFSSIEQKDWISGSQQVMIVTKGKLIRAQGMVDVLLPALHPIPEYQPVTKLSNEHY